MSPASASTHCPTHLLGHAWASPELQSFMGGWAALSWLDEEELETARNDHRLSVMNEQHGLYLFFTDLANYRTLYGKPRLPGALILSRVCFVLDFAPDWTPYAGALPLGLEASDTFATARQRIGEPLRTWTAGSRVCKARWQDGNTLIDVSFAMASSQIKLVNVVPQQVAPEAPSAKPALPSPAELIACFGEPLSALQSKDEFHALHLEEKADEIGRYHEADFSQAFGLELYFQPSARMADDWPKARLSAEPCLSGMRYRAVLDFQSTGYTGPLPWDLDMDDPMAVVERKVGKPPFKQHIDPLDGYQRWRTGIGDVHVLYSFLEDRIFRVTVLARGCSD